MAAAIILRAVTRAHSKPTLTLAGAAAGAAIRLLE